MPNRLPKGWDQEKVRRVLAHYEGQPEDKAVAEDEADRCSSTDTLMSVLHELVPAVRELIAKAQVGLRRYRKLARLCSRERTRLHRIGATQRFNEQDS